MKTERGISQSAKREIRRIQIIDAALRIFAEEGYSKFSLRNVALKAGLSLGTVQYYFKNKIDLFHAVIEYKLTLARKSLDQSIRDSDGTPMTNFKSLIKTMFRDNKVASTLAVDLQFFALASTDASVAKLLIEFYETIQQWVEAVLKSLNLSLSDEQLKLKGLMILSIVEGMMQVVYLNENNKNYYDELEEMVLQQVVAIATTS